MVNLNIVVVASEVEGLLQAKAVEHPLGHLQLRLLPLVADNLRQQELQLVL